MWIHSENMEIIQETWLKMYTLVLLCVCVLFTQLFLTLCDPMDCSAPGSSVLKILQAIILEWVAIPFSRLVLLLLDNYS